MLDDNEIISMYQKRDESVLSHVSGKYGAACYSIAYGILKNRRD